MVAEIKRDTVLYSDERAERFMSLYMSIQRRLYGFVACLVPDVTAVEDIIQETVMFMWHRFDEFQPGTDFRAWAFSVAKNRIFDHVKEQQRIMRHFSPETIQVIEETVESRSKTVNGQLEALQSCILKLAARDRKLLSFRYKDGASLKSVADEIQQSINTIYNRLYKIRIALMECVNKTLASNL